MAKIGIVVNGSRRTVTASSQMPLLWVLRDSLGLTGTKFGCARGFCGACTVLLDGEAVRSCVTSLDSVAGKSVTTIEGLSRDLSHPLQKAWTAEDVPQCGYCQPGQIMSAAGLLLQKPNPTDDDINAALEGNVCRCGTYNRIRRAIHLAAASGSGATRGGK